MPANLDVLFVWRTGGKKLRRMKSYSQKIN